MIDSLDQPLLTAITYFTYVMNYFMRIAATYGVAFGTIGLCWQAFKLINKRIQIRELWWDTLYKWIIYIFLCACWVPLTNGVSSLANTIGGTAGRGAFSIETEMKKFRNEIYGLSEMETDEIGEKMKKLAEENQLSIAFGDLKVTDYGSAIIEAIQEMDASNRKKEKLIKKVKEEQAELTNLHSLKTLEAINQLIGSKNDAASYVATSLKLKGDKHGYLSAASIFRFALLICDIYWLQNEIEFKRTINDLEDNSQLNKMEKSLEKVKTSLTNIVEKLICLVMCFGILLSSIFTIIQYMMTCVEFTIIAAIGAFFIPFVLLDSTKEITKKFLPVFISLFVKLLVITMCMFYVMWSYLNIAHAVIKGGGGINWFNIGCILLQIIFGFILTSNAPKIATTITTGQAQLSMGEFVAAAGVGLGAAKLANKGVQTAHRTYEKGAQHHSANVAGKQAKNEVKVNGGTKKEMRQASSYARHSVYNPNGFHAKNMSGWQAGSSTTNNLNYQKNLNQRVKEMDSKKKPINTQANADAALDKYKVNESPDA